MGSTRDVVGTSDGEILADLLDEVLAGRRSAAELSTFVATARPAAVPGLVRFLERSARAEEGEEDRASGGEDGEESGGGFRGGAARRRRRAVCREALSVIRASRASAAPHPADPAP